MARTRVFKSGNSQAVRIPAELAYEDGVSELTITKQGDVIMLFPARSSLREAVAKLRTMPAPSAVEVYEPIEMPEREGDWRS